MRRITLIFLALWASTPAGASDVVEDAFGIVPATGMSADRAAWSGLRTADTAEETQSPHDTRTVLIFAGAKSLVAGRDPGHAVALALDPYGNLAADGAAATFTIAGNAQAAVPLRNGRADLLFQPGTRAGTYAAGAAVDGVQSARALYRVTTDLASVAPILARTGQPLVPETFAAYETTPLRDRFGNEVEDGIALGFTLTHADGSTSLMTGHARDGQAEARLLVRDITAPGAVAATLAATASPDLSADLAPLTPAAPAPATAWAVSELDATALRVGPFTTSAGHMLTDGAPVSVTVETADGARDTRAGWLRDGHFEALLPLSPDAGPLNVTIDSPLGRETLTLALTDAPTAVRGAE